MTKPPRDFMKPHGATLHLGGDDTFVLRLQAQTNVTPTGCWLFMGGATGDGYGRLREGSRTDSSNRMALAHRGAYERLVGPVPAGMQLDHLCHTRALIERLCRGGPTCLHRRCWNIEHLAPVTPRENAQRGAHAVLLPDACLRGHRYDAANTARRPDGSRRCRACNAAEARSRYVPSGARA